MRIRVSYTDLPAVEVLCGLGLGRLGSMALMRLYFLHHFLWSSSVYSSTCCEVAGGFLPWEACEHKESDRKSYHNRTHWQMFTQLPLEIIDHIFGYLSFKDIRSIACVCSAFRMSGQRRLFRTIYIRIDPYNYLPSHTQCILSYRRLLQYPSALIVQPYDCAYKTGTSSGFLWNILPKMYRLSYVEITLGPRECLRALSALKRCGSVRQIALRPRRTFTPDELISDTPLLVHTLDLMMDASGHQLAARVVQKCSQTLRRLDLFLKNGITPTLPFLPHLSELSFNMEVITGVYGATSDHDFMSWFPFLDRHPTITRLLLSTRFTLTVQPSPNLLPDLQFLKATPAIIERLVPGRPVNYIRVNYPSRLAYGLPFHANTMLRPLRQSLVPMTVLEIMTDTFIPSDGLVDMIQALPKLRKFVLEDPGYEVRQLFEGRRNPELIEHRFLSPFKTC